tara:strand:+ start:1846 stop:2949 length:1104 start_codon:yes stop_codon:yes gene_type:complete
MILVVLFHAMLPYSTPDFYPYVLHSTKYHVAIDYIMLPMHCIMMPIFFLLSGYFSHLMFQNKGQIYFIRERAVKLGIPLLIGMILFIPLHFLVYLQTFLPHVDNIARHQSKPLSTIIGSVFATDLHNGSIYQIFFNPEYLWFIYYLLIYCTISIFCCWVKQKINLNYVLPQLSIIPLLLISVGLWVILSSFNLPYILTPITLTPSMQPLITYGVFYLLGWFYFSQPDNMLYFKNNYLILTLVASISLSIYAGLMLKYYHTSMINWSYQVTIPITFFLVISMMFITHAFIGLFAKFLDFYHFILAYLARISYWTYLIKIPFLLILQYFLIKTTIPIIFQLLLASLGAILLSAVSHQYLIKTTCLRKIC